MKQQTKMKDLNEYVTPLNEESQIPEIEESWDKHDEWRKLDNESKFKFLFNALEEAYNLAFVNQQKIPT